MPGLLALAALAAAGAVGTRWLIRARRGRRAATTATATAAATATPADVVPHVTPDATDRTVIAVDNGGRPFAVRFSYKRRVATVYLVRYLDGGELDTSSDVFRSFRYQRAFIGLDPREPEAKMKKEKMVKKEKKSGASGGGAAAPPPEAPVWWYGGNSVLLDLGQRRYVYIGAVIYAFTAYDDIQEYVSTMGNSAVPYPFAVGAKNTYLLAEDTYIPNHIIKLHSAEDQKDPYHVLYTNELCRFLPGADPRQRPLAIGSHHGLQAWKQSFPLKDFELLCERRL